MAGTAFLSYSHEDKQHCDELVPMLQSVRVIRDCL